MDLHEIAAEAAEKQARNEAEAFERALCPFKATMATTMLAKAAETINRLGKAAQDCRSCARLPECNAYESENRFENCDYIWTQAEAVRRLADETLQR